MTDSLVWETPPAEAPPKKPTTSERWTKVAAQLRENPNEWAIVSDDSWQSLVHQISKGTIVAFRPAGAYEARPVREDTHAKQKAKIFARYIGTPSDVSIDATAATPADAVSAIARAFRHYVEPVRSGDHAALRNGVSLFDAALRNLEKELSA